MNGRLMAIEWRITRRWLWSAFKVIYYLLFILALGLISHIVWDNWSSLHAIWQIPPYLWVIPAVIYLGTLGSKGLSFDILARVHGMRVPTIDSFGLTACSLLSSYAVPGMSISLRTLYLHRVLGLHYKHFLSVVLAAFVFSTGLYGIFAGVAALMYARLPSSSYALVMLAFSGGGLTLVVALLLSYGWLPVVGHPIERILAGWRLLLRARGLFAAWLCAEVLRATLEVAFFYSIIRLLEIEITLPQTAIMVLAKECSVFLRLTPGAFGLAEGVQVFFGLQFGVDAAAILLAAIVARVIELLCLSLISSVLAPRLGRKLTRGARQWADAGARPIEP
jgi:uncharacterized membrane protein YbhN (UPF0104 family)